LQIVTSDSVFSYSDLQILASEHGFPLFGVTPAVEAQGFERLGVWLERGYAGEMDYLAKRLEAYRHPSGVLPTVQSLILLGMPYSPARSLRPNRQPLEAGLPAKASSPTDRDCDARDHIGQVAAYASGQVDYHDLIHSRLKSMIRWMKQRLPTLEARGVVDSAPLLEREFATLAGLGWIGKNTLVLNRNYGSYFFLAAILVDLELPVSSQQAIATDHCGTCTACLDACPTQAFPQAYLLDATRCISYLTIEHRSPIDEGLASSIGDHVFGCDVCQQVCPWNRMAHPTTEPDLQTRPSSAQLDLIELLAMDETAFRNRFRKTPLWRTKLTGMIRNAILVLANQNCRKALPMIQSLQHHADAGIREAALFASQRLQ
jgi:epoxyqueuosine reductase